MRKFLFGSIILLQLGVIFILGFHIYNKQKVLGEVSISPILKDSIVSNSTSTLKYLFEPLPDSVASEQAELKWVDKKSIAYTINHDTLNETKDYEIDKPENTYRIIALGDSFTFGLYVNTSENWTSLLEEKLAICSDKEYEVINLALAGNDIQYSVERFRLRGAKYDPDLVIWLLKHDDFTDINELLRANEEKYRTEMKESGEYKQRLEEGVPNPVLGRLLEEMEKMRESIGKDKFFDMQTSYLEEIYSIFSRKLLFMFIPFSNDLRYKEYLQTLQSNRQNTFFLELPSFPKHEEFAFRPYDWHPNKKGHEMIAEKTYEYLISNNIVQCD